MEIRICTNWYFLQSIIYSVALSKNRSYRRIFHLRIRLFTNLFNYRQSFVERWVFDVRLEIQLPFNSTFSSCHYCFFVQMERKKLVKKHKKETNIVKYNDVQKHKINFISTFGNILIIHCNSINKCIDIFTLLIISRKRIYIEKFIERERKKN